MVSESKKVYKGTYWEGTFLIFHDALSAWWEKGAQDHMAALGFAHRQLRCTGDTNKEFKRYHKGLVGDSPELCRGLDAYGFADLDADTTRNSTLSSVLPHTDERRFKLGTPAEVWWSMARTWEYSPSSERIVEDISALPRVLDVIIEHKGCVVPDLFLRSGRRALTAQERQDGKAGAVINAPRKRQRKATLEGRKCHHTLECCRELLKSGEVVFG